KTGDLGKWHADGSITFLGRRDDQIKIRGYRVELSEIENVLLKLPEIKAAVVQAISGAVNEPELVAYVVAGSDLQITNIRSALSRHLPAYMLPHHYIELAEIPLTPNGKVDRKNLPDPADTGMGTGVAYLAPRDEIEEKLLHIWREVLGKEKISVKDNFFDLGGHSLKATRLAGQIHKTFGVSIGLKEIFETLILEDQASLISR